MVEKPSISIKDTVNTSTPSPDDAHVVKSKYRTPTVKKKVQLNTKVQYMDADGSTEMGTIGSPDLNDDSSDDSIKDDDNSDMDSDSGALSDQDSDDMDTNMNSDDDGSVYEDKDYSSDDDEDEEDMQLAEDAFGPLQYRDPNDKEFLLGFELRHFELDDDTGFDNINLRNQEKTHEDTSLNDNLAFGLVNALLNSSDKTEKRKGKKLLKKLKFKLPKIEPKVSSKMKMNGKPMKPTTTTMMEPKANSTSKIDDNSWRPPTTIEPKINYKIKVTNKSWRPIQMGPNQPRCSNKRSVARTRQAQRSENLKQLIASTVNEVNMTG